MELYPFSRLSAPANVLIMPGLQSANLSAKLLRELGGATTIGPMLIGMEKPVQIVPMTAIAPDVLTLAVLGGGLDWQLDILADAIGITDVVRLSVPFGQIDIVIVGIGRIDDYGDVAILQRIT